MITLRAYLKACYERQLYLKRSWRIQVMLRVENPKTHAYYPVIQNEKWGFVDENGEFIEITGVGGIDKPLLSWKTVIDFEPEDLPSIKVKTSALYGVWLVNLIGWAHFYGEKILFQNRVMGPNDLHEIYYQAKQAGTLTSAKTVIDSVTALETLLATDCELGVTAADKAMFGTDPEIEAEKAKLLKEYGDRLQDPVIQAEFDKKMSALYVKRAQATASRDFYGTGGKIFGVVLAKTDVRYGSESGIDGQPTEFISKPLKEGLDIERMPSWVNAARGGSYSRGGLTAESGYGVKKGQAAYGALLVSDIEDCGTKEGLTVYPTRKNYRLFRGMYELGHEKDGLLEDVNLHSFIGRALTLRVPGRCKAEAGTYCKTCMGGATKRNAIPSGVTSIDSKLMDVRMQSAHGKMVQAVRVDPKANFS